jgi:hypothetical protein
MGTSKGRGKYIKPNEFIKLFADYKIWIEANPRVKEHLSQRTGTMVKESIKRPMSIDGFEIYIYNYRGVDVTEYFKNPDGKYSEYSPVLSHIRKEIREDQVSGAMSNVYNGNIVARINGLTEKVDTKLEVTEIAVKFE